MDWSKSYFGRRRVNIRILRYEQEKISFSLGMRDEAILEMLSISFLFQIFTRNMKMSKFLLLTLLVVASVLVTSSSPLLKVSSPSKRIQWCGEFCKTPDYNECQQIYSSKW